MNEDLREVLIILQEECAEVIVEISKCFRFGPDQIMQGQEFSNIQRLEKEIGDVEAMIELLQDLKVGVSEQGTLNAKMQKFEKLKLFSNLDINK